MSGAPIRISILANGRQARAEMGATAAAGERMGASFGKIGKLIGGAFAIGALVRAGEAVGKVGASYVDSLNKIQALTGATNSQLDAAAKKLESNSAAYAKLGASTGDAALGVVELAKSGLSLKDSLGAVGQTLVLAKAGALDVGDASALVANTLNTFNLKASQAGQIANDLANAANISSADVSDLAESFKYVSPLAAASGLSLAQTNAALAILANGGVKASQAGTGLRKFLASLQSPAGAAATSLTDLGVSVYDAQGKMRPLGAIIGDLNKGLSKVDQQTKNRDLKNIFGLQGITSASLLLKQGTKGLDAATKGVQALGGAAKFAEASTKGLAGTFLTIKANATSFLQSAYRQYSPQLNSAIQSLIGFLSDNADKFAAVASEVGSHLGPALSALVKLVKDTAAAFAGGSGSLAGSLGGTLLSALNIVSDIVTKVAGALDKLPGPVKVIAVEIGIAALVFPRLAAGVAAATVAIKDQVLYLGVLKLEMQDTAARSALLGTAMTKIGAAAKSVSGIAGLVALTEGFKHADSSAGVLLDTLGGAAIGAQVGGPFGALLGAAGGAVVGLFKMSNAVDSAAASMQKAIPDASDYAGTLSSIDAAATAATKSQILLHLQTSGAIEAGSRLGLTSRDLVNSLLGQEGASKRVSAALKNLNKAMVFGALSGKEDLATSQRSKDYDLLSAALAGTTERLKADTAAKRQDIRVNQDYSGLLHKIPKSVFTKIDSVGIGPSVKGVAKVAASYKSLQSKSKIRLLIQAAGIDATVGQVQRMIVKLKSVDKVKPSLNAYRANFRGQLNGVDSELARSMTSIRNKLHDSTKGVTPDLSAVTPGVIRALAAARGAASSGGYQIGAAIKAGAESGLAGMADALAARASSAVSIAIAAAKRAGGIQSPSKKMHYLGRMLAKGLGDGLDKGKPGVEKSGKNFVENLLRGIDNGAQGIGKVIDRIDALVAKTFKKRESETVKHLRATLKGAAESSAVKAAEKRSRTSEKALEKSLKNQHQLLKANGKLQDQNNKKLDAAQQKFKDLANRAKDYAKSIKDSAVSYGSVVGLGTQDGGTSVSLTRLLSQLQARAADTKTYAKLIEQLREQGLNRTTIQQLLDAGVEGGLQTAQALASGGKAAIGQINALTSQITATGTSLGAKMEKAYFSAGLKAAQGLVDGLNKKQRDLDKVAQRLADALVTRVKNALGIKSPSRVFRDIGLQTVKGLSIGIDDTYASKAGARLATSLQSGFGTPALDAMASGRVAVAGTGGGNVYITVNAPVGASSVDIGKTVVKHIDAYLAVGGRSKMIPRAA